MSILTAFRKNKSKDNDQFLFSHIQQTVGAAFGENIILKIPLVQVMYKSKGRNEIALSYSIPTYQYIYGKQLYSLFLY